MHQCINKDSFDAQGGRTVVEAKAHPVAGYLPFRSAGAD